MSGDRAESFTFTLLLQGANPLTPEHLHALFAHGCDDATFGQRDSLSYGDFDRQAPSFAEAVSSAIRDVERAVPGLRVVRVEPEELVSASAIAERTGRSRESVRLLIEAKRGPGGFPPPAAWAGAKRRLWRWSDVAHWFATYGGEQTGIDSTSSFIAGLNGALDVRRHAAHLAGAAEREAIASILSEAAELLSVTATPAPGATPRRHAAPVPA